MSFDEEIRRASNLDLAKYLVLLDGECDGAKRKQRAILREFERREKYFATVTVENLMEIQRSEQLLGVIKHLVYDKWLYEREGTDEKYLLAIVELLNAYGWRQPPRPSS